MLQARIVLSFRAGRGGAGQGIHIISAAIEALRPFKADADADTESYRRVSGVYK